MSETNETPTVLWKNGAKNRLVEGFLSNYRQGFDNGADTRELFTDVITDLLHVLSRDLESEGEWQETTPGEVSFLDHIDDVVQTAIGHYVAETLYVVEPSTI